MSLEPPPDLIESTVELMDVTSEIEEYEEDREGLRDIIANLCEFGDAQQEKSDRTLPGYVCTITRTSPPTEVALVAVFEEKSELGVNGDPTVQASFSYVNYWADHSRQLLRTVSCCPSFIISLAGPWIAICEGVIVGRPIVQRLTGYIWLSHSRVIDDAYAFRVARIFYSLRLSIKSLHDYYIQPNFPSINNARSWFFPSITSYRVEDKIIEFEYIRPLDFNEPVCVTYLAKQLIPQTNVVKHTVVKFADRYGAEAHKLLATKNLAPQLLYCELLTLSQGVNKYSYGNLRMVVMDYVEGQIAEELYYYSLLPSALKRVVQGDQECLSEASLVHGDLRKANILIPKDGDVEKALIIDFDWAGEADKVRYPLHLSAVPGLWVDGVQSYGLIRIAHDKAVVDRL